MQKLRHYCDALFYQTSADLSSGPNAKQSGSSYPNSLVLRKFFGAKVIEKRLQPQDFEQEVKELKAYCITSEKIFNLRKQSNRPVDQFYAYEHFREDELRELLYALPHSRASNHIVHSLRITEAQHLKQKFTVAKRWARLFASLAAASQALPTAVPLPIPVAVALRKVLGSILSPASEEALKSNMFAVLLDCYNISQVKWEEFWPAASVHSEAQEQSAQMQTEPIQDFVFPFARSLANATSQNASQASTLALLARVSKASASTFGKRTSSIWAKRLARAAPAAAALGIAGMIYSRIYRSGLELAKSCEKKWLQDLDATNVEPVAKRT